MSVCAELDFRLNAKTLVMLQLIMESISLTVSRSPVVTRSEKVSKKQTVLSIQGLYDNNG